jgi:tetratricopeptide (TPR) repeat protein
MQTVPTIETPTTVQAVLAARIDRLPPEEKHLLQTAAVIGTEVPLPLLHAVAELPDAALHGGLVHLQAAEFLYETRLFPAHEYTFKHALTQEVAYNSLLQERRRVLHTRIVEIIEVLAGDRVAEQVDHLAYHALHGEVWDKAFRYSRQAGARAEARSAYREAVACFEQALRVLQHLPESRNTLEQAIDLRLDLRTALTPSGDSQSRQRILTLLHEAEALAVALDDPRRLGQVCVMLTQYFFYRDMHDQVIVTSQRAIALAAASGDNILQALANLFPGFSYISRGDCHSASDCLGQTVAALDGTQRYELLGLTSPPALFARALLLLCHAELGTFVAGRVLGEEGLQFAEMLAHSYTLSFACYGLGLLCLRQGDLSRALPLLERAVGICRDADIPAGVPRMGAALGAAYTLAGRLADAIPLLTQAREQSAATGRAHQETLCSLPLGDAHLLAGRLEEAHALAKRALALAREPQERGHEAYALRLLGDIAARRGPLAVEQAETYYRQALTRAKALGMRPLQAHCHRGLGTLYVAIGQQEPARTALSTALALYRAMDMTFWLPQTETALVQVL